MLTSGIDPGRTSRRAGAAGAHCGGPVRADRDLLGALAVFLLVFLATFPVAVPFVVIHDLALAMRLSNAVAVAMLLVIGTVYGRTIERSPWIYGMAVTALGCVLVALTIALGG
jgi:VIT1/CCC1 family predicted Fe2+/Mn2+ transporter